MMAYSFPTLFTIIGSVVSIDVAPPDAIGANFPKYLAKNGATKRVIISLKILAGESSLPGYDYPGSDTDVNGDNRIGIEEAIYILKRLRSANFKGVRKWSR